MEYNDKAKEWAKGFSKGASGQGQVGILKKWFGGEDDESAALEKRRRRKESAQAAPVQDSPEYPA